MKKNAIFLLALILNFAILPAHAFWGSWGDKAKSTAKEVGNAMDLAKEKAKMLDHMLKNRAPGAHAQVHDLIGEIKDDIVPMLKEAGFDAEKWIRSGSEGKALIATLYYQEHSDELTAKAEKAMEKWKRKASDILKEHIDEVLD